MLTDGPFSTKVMVMYLWIYRVDICWLMVHYLPKSWFCICAYMI